MRLIIVEDDEEHLSLITHALKGVDVDQLSWVSVGSLSETKAALEKEVFSLMLLDLSLPDSNYHETLGRVSEFVGDIPIVVLTSLDDRHTMRSIIKQGAADCLPKTLLNAHNLERSIVYSLDRVRLREEAIHREGLLQQEKSFHSLFERSNIGFVIVRDNGRVVEANPAFAQYLKVEAGTLTNLQFEELVLDGDRPEWVKISQVLLDDKEEDISRELKLLKSNSDVVPVDLTLRKIDWYGEGICYLASVFDLTDRNQKQERLLEALDKAESANRAKSALFSMISHDVRTPVAAIISMARLLNESDLSPDDKDMALIINQQGESLLNLIDDILGFSQIDQGRVKILPGDCNLEEFTRSIRELFDHLLQEKQLEYIMSSRIEEKTVWMDETRVRQILVNLIGNAIKFTPKGGRIFLDLSKEEDFIVFRVVDTGIGISDTDLKNLFMPFKQANDSIKSQYGGNGLGLSICKQLCELMRGSISATSKPGEGSSFTVKISLAQA